MMSEDEGAKQIEAFRRAMPITRMLDYGMTRSQAERAHREAQEGEPWDEALEAIAATSARSAETADAEGRSADAAEDWRASAACLIFAQMAFNFDTDRKRSLYRRMTARFAEFARRAPLAIDKVEVAFGTGRLFGWHCRKSAQTRAPTVIVFGGMSGWSTAYFAMAEALCERGLACLLVDGPGQGESRLEGRVFLDAGVSKGFALFVDVAREVSGGASVGIWGNSFGGLFAALTAATDSHISACCINGAPTRCDEPPFRTAAEQMAAMFGRADLSGVRDVMSALAFDPTSAALRCPILVLEGGADPLVPLRSQAAFRSGNRDPRSRTLTWQDGEHTIYNHAAERNAAVAEWFGEVLRASC